MPDDSNSPTARASLIDKTEKWDVEHAKRRAIERQPDGSFRAVDRSGLPAGSRPRLHCIDTGAPCGTAASTPCICSTCRADRYVTALDAEIVRLRADLEWIDRQRYENRETIPAAIDSPPFRRIRENHMAIMNRARDALAAHSEK